MDDKIEFPKWLYHLTDVATIVQNAEEQDALGPEWHESPADLVAEKDSGTQVNAEAPVPEVKLAGLNKANLIAHAKEQHALELDPKLTNAELIAKIEEARAKVAEQAGV